MTTVADVDAVRAALGREPTADFTVVVRDAHGAPVVVQNAPFTRDATPMPTRYWLVDRDLARRVARLEATGAASTRPGSPPRTPGTPPSATRSYPRRTPDPDPTAGSAAPGPA